MNNFGQQGADGYGAGALVGQRSSKQVLKVWFMILLNYLDLAGVSVQAFFGSDKL